MDVKDSELRLVTGAGCAKCMNSGSKNEQFARFRQGSDTRRKARSIRMQLNPSELGNSRTMTALHLLVINAAASFFGRPSSPESVAEDATARS
jgi:hypothetical protein